MPHAGRNFVVGDRWDRTRSDVASGRCSSGRDVWVVVCDVLLIAAIEVRNRPPLTAAGASPLTAAGASSDSRWRLLALACPRLPRPNLPMFDVPDP